MQRRPYEINMTPFIDVLLVLLVILMLSARSLAEKGIGVNLPQIVEGENLSATHAPIDLQIERAGHLRLNGQKLTLAQLIPEISAFSPSQKILLRADASLNYETVFQIINRLHLAGYSKLALVGLERKNSPSP